MTGILRYYEKKKKMPHHLYYTICFTVQVHVHTDIQESTDVGISMWSRVIFYVSRTVPYKFLMRHHGLKNYILIL
jgi:hypothetical protein